MATRAILAHQIGPNLARVSYLHFDGYPESALELLRARAAYTEQGLAEVLTGVVDARGYYSSLPFNSMGEVKDVAHCHNDAPVNVPSVGEYGATIGAEYAYIADSRGRVHVGSRDFRTDAWTWEVVK